MFKPAPPHSTSSDRAATLLQAPAVHSRAGRAPSPSCPRPRPVLNKAFWLQMRLPL